MGAVAAVDDGLKRFYKYKPGREVEAYAIIRTSQKVQ